MKTILASTYAVNPYKGSEDGMGWNFVLQIARFHKVIAITRKNNRASIEQYMIDHPHEVYANIQFLYFDLPYWMRWWKKGSRGAMLYYLLWQVCIVPFIKKQKIQFDIVHNVNFHNDWSPSFLWKLGKPMVWGPVGHHPLIPQQYLKPYSIKYWFKDRLTWMVKLYFWNCSYHLHKTKQNASHIMCMNTSVPNALRLKNNYSIAPSVASQDFGWVANKDLDQFTVISAGRLVPLKGFDLTIEAFAKMVKALPIADQSKCQLILVGSGPEKEMFDQLIVNHNIEHMTTFISWIERAKLLDIMQSASVFLFPSHEGAGMVMAEALSFGLPVVCLKNEGPGEYIDASCGMAIPESSYPQTIEALSSAIKTLFADHALRKAMAINARQKFVDVFHWDRRGEQLQKIYASI